MTDKARFTAMKHASGADYDWVFTHEAEAIKEQTDQVIS